MTATAAPTDRYVADFGWTDRVAQRLARRLTRVGLSLWGSRELRVVGRRSGEVRTTIVNVLDHEGGRFLVAPRGVAQWVRNVRAAGGGELRLGRRVDAFRARELPEGPEKVAVLRAYLARWQWEVGRFFDGVDASASDEELAAIAPGYPVFALA